MVNIPQLARLHMSVHQLHEVAGTRDTDKVLAYLLAQHEKRVEKFLTQAESDYAHHRTPTVLPYWVSVAAYRQAHSGNPRQNVPVEALNAPAVEAAAVCHALHIPYTWQMLGDEPLSLDELFAQPLVLPLLEE